MGHQTTEVASVGVRVRFRVRFQAVKVPIFGGFPVENPTKKATTSKVLLRGISLSEYGSEGLRVQLRRFSEYGSVAYPRHQNDHMQLFLFSGINFLKITITITF